MPLVLIVGLYAESAKLILYNAVTTEHNAGTPFFEDCCAQVFRNHFVSAKYEIRDAVHAVVMGVAKVGTTCMQNITSASASLTIRAQTGDPANAIPKSPDEISGSV